MGLTKDDLKSMAEDIRLAAGMIARDFHDLRSDIHLLVDRQAREFAEKAHFAFPVMNL